MIGLEGRLRVLGDQMGIEITVGTGLATIGEMEVETRPLYGRRGKTLCIGLEVLVKMFQLRKRFVLPTTLALFFPCLFVLLLVSGCAEQAEQGPPVESVTPPTGMAYVPGGTFLTGSDTFASDPDVGPLREARVAAFFIDKTEVSNAEVKAVWPEHSFPKGEEAHPATGLDWDTAQAVLSKMGKRLPTALEWELASRGRDGRVYPWGNDSDSSGKAHVGRPDSSEAAKGHKVCAFGQLLPVDSYPDGASPFGLLNTVGNAWEWVSDPPTEQRPYHLIKGGAYGYRDRHNRLDTVSYEQPGTT